ncbi:MAG: NAD-dependent epimerase/dehydratase family protein [Gemmataceae bacterium]
MTRTAEFDWTGRRVAVTGATGFVGWHVAAQLRARGADVLALHRAGSNIGNLRRLGVQTVLAGLDDPAALTNACHGAEVLIHTAGAVDFGGDWAGIRAVNVHGTANAIAAARAAGVRRLVHVSSIVAVGGGTRAMLLDETAEWNLSRYRVPYATTKREAETLALQAARDDLEVVVVNPGCVVGPEDFSESEFGRVCKRFWRGRLPLHFGGGNNFVDVRDVADASWERRLKAAPANVIF